MPSWGVLAVVAVRAMPARVALSPLTNAGQAPIANRVMTCLVQQSYNTTSTNGIPPTHTTEVVAALETPRDQDEHRLAPTTTLITRRSQVQILSPPLDRRPGNIEFPGLLRSPPEARPAAFYRDLYRVELGRPSEHGRRWGVRRRRGGVVRR